MPALERTLGLLDLFTPESPVHGSDGLIAHLNCPPSTGYRHIKALQAAGLLTRVGSGSYMLGPRVLELDRTVRMSDPVFKAGSPIIRGLSERTRHSSALSILFSDSVMCVHRELTPDGPPTLFDRGERRPLVAGASAKAILAHLPSHQLRRIFGRYGPDIAAAGLGEGWDAFRRRLRDIRRAGSVMSVAEYRPRIASIAAPIFNRDGEVLGSLMLAISTDHPGFAGFPDFAPAVVEAARHATASIARLGQVALPARGVASG